MSKSLQNSPEKEEKEAQQPARKYHEKVKELKIPIDYVVLDENGFSFSGHTIPAKL